jgi:hypothetical protein
MRTSASAGAGQRRSRAGRAENQQASVHPAAKSANGILK